MFRCKHAARMLAMLASTLCLASAHADMYVWTDNAGVTNISNLPPPEGMRLVSVTRAAPKDPVQEAANREAARQAEMRALSERVQQLQAEVEQARREPAPTIVVQQPPPTPAAPYVVVVAPPPAPAYAQPFAGCDFAWGNCGLGYWPGHYPASVVVVRDRHFRRDHPIHHGPPRHFGGRGILPGIHSSLPVAKPVHGRK